MIFEPLNNRGIGIFDKYPLPQGNLTRKLTIIIDGTYDRNLGVTQNLIVIFTEAWSCVDNTAPVGHGHVIA
jgi:hypothetical protein